MIDKTYCIHIKKSGVLKLVEYNGQPVAKLSDSLGKTMIDDTYLAYLKQVFGVQG